ncbi:sulfite exporter TauE/SafE family protein [Shewanella sp. MF08487]|uniref:sulfite exporter TauE/SafE family protein n=1 Tax=Shewanella sp. MF08487 TaxID=3434873 RepID=UPI003D7AE6A6
MELLLEPSHWALLAVIGLIAGFIDAVVGGGGLLSIPALLALGMPPHTVLGTNKLAASFGSSMAAWTYYRQHLFTPSFWYMAFIATFIGAVLGSFLVYLVDTQWLEKVLPLMIIGIAIYSLVSPNAISDINCQAPIAKPPAKKQWLQGLILGTYDGFAGPGIGAFWTVTSGSLYQLPLLHSCGLARAMTFTSNLTALAIFGWLGQVQWQIGLGMGLCMMLGSFIGARCAIKFGMPFIRPLFILIVLMIAANLAWSAWL